VAKGGAKYIANAVKETLDSVVSPSVRDAILARALAVGRMTIMPTEASALSDFVQGPLHDSLVQSLGSELGVSVTTEIERLVALAAPHTARPSKIEASTHAPAPARKPSTKFSAPTRRPSRSTMPSRVLPPGSAVSKDQRWADAEARGISPTMPASRRTSDAGEIFEGQSRASGRRPGQLEPSSADFPAGTANALGVIGTASVDPSSGARPHVFVASTDPELLRVFRAWLDMRAKVEPVTGVRELVASLAASEQARTVVVLDGKNPGVRPLALAALAEDLGAETQVLLWGVAPHLHAKMRNISVVTEKWLVYGTDAPTNELVARCAKIVG
jgi:hypothetical protein